MASRLILAYEDATYTLHRDRIGHYILTRRAGGDCYIQGDAAFEVERVLEALDEVPETRRSAMFDMALGDLIA